MVTTIGGAIPPSGVEMFPRAVLAFCLMLCHRDVTGNEAGILRLADSILIANGPLCAADQAVKAAGRRAALTRAETKALQRELSGCKSLFEGLQSDFAAERSVIRLLVRHRALPALADSKPPESIFMGPDNPVFIGFMLLTGPGVDLKTVDSEESLSLVSRSLGVRREPVLLGYRELFRQGVDGLLGRLAGQIQANLKETDPARFATHVVFPYLALLHHGMLLPPELEASITKGFCQAFPKCAGGNPLRRFATDFRRQVAGGSAGVQSGIDLNRVLGGASLHMRCDHGQAELYRVSGASIPVGRHGIGKVILLERTLPFHLGAERGLSILGDPDVYVTRDHVDDFMDRQRGFLEGGKPPIQYTPAADAFWRSERMAMTSARADSINARLARMEFRRDNLVVRSRDLLLKIAIHEVRHKWDELRRGGPRHVTDLEYFAHTSEILFGPLPLHSLSGTIRRLEDFCGEMEDKQARAIFVEEIRAMWEYAEKISEGRMDVKELRRSIGKRYAAYATRDGGSKGELGDFEALVGSLRVR